MNRADLITRVADTTGLPKADTGKAVDATFEAITAALVRGEEFTLVGFGTFAVTERAAREGRNPKTGEPIQIPAQQGAQVQAGEGAEGRGSGMSGAPRK